VGARGDSLFCDRMHDCGRLPPTNHDHGVYVEGAVDTVISDSLIYDNANRGIQLFPNAQRFERSGWQRVLRGVRIERQPRHSQHRQQLARPGQHRGPGGAAVFRVGQRGFGAASGPERPVLWQASAIAGSAALVLAVSRGATPRRTLTAAARRAGRAALGQPLVADAARRRALPVPGALDRLKAKPRGDGGSRGAQEVGRVRAVSNRPLV
jgi:hypothetical protein